MNELFMLVLVLIVGVVAAAAGYRQGRKTPILPERRKRINGNILAVEVAKIEGGKVNQPITEIKEAISATRISLRGYTDEAILRWVHR